MRVSLLATDHYLINVIISKSTEHQSAAGTNKGIQFL